MCIYIYTHICIIFVGPLGVKFFVLKAGHRSSEKPGCKGNRLVAGG